MRFTITLIAVLAVGLPLACSSRQSPMQANAKVSNYASSIPHDGENDSTAPGTIPIRTVSDVPLTGGATRLDYQSLDSENGRLYIAHLGSDLMTVFDVNKQTIVGDVKDLKRVHGVLAVPELHRIYASATGSNELAVIDDSTLQIIARAPAGDYPDGVGADPDVFAFDKSFGRLYVSAESGVITIFDEQGRNLEKVGEGFFAANAHSVAVDQRTHRIYFPLQNVGGKPILRIAVPSDKQI